MRIQFQGHIHFIPGGGEDTYFRYKLLLTDILDILHGQRRFLTEQRCFRRYILGHHHIIGFHESRLVGHDRLNIPIQLQTQHDDRQTDDVRQHKTT